MTTTTQTSVLQTVERLSPRLRAIAWRVADASTGYDPEDIYQDMTLSLIERNKHEPAFLRQKDAYILSHCSWRGRNEVASGRVYDKYNQPENQEFELICDRLAGPEEEAEKCELLAGLENVIERLSVLDRKIISLLAIDCTSADIARELNVSRSAISQRLHRIRKTLATFLEA